METDGSSINEVKGIISQSLGPVVGDNPYDIVAPAGAIVAGQIQASFQTPNSLLTRFSRRDFTQVGDEDLLSVAATNRHIGLPYKMLHSPAPAVHDMALDHDPGTARLYPYYIKLGFTSPDPGTQGGGSSLVQSFWDPNDRRRRAYISNYFLQQIMIANIYNFENGSFSDDDTSTLPYGSIDFSAKVSEGDSLSYYGFDWTTSNSNWAQSAAATQPYPLRTIDITNLFVNFFKYQTAPDHIATGIENRHGASRHSYTGFLGQSITKRVADNQGIIVGETFHDAPADTLNTAILGPQLEKYGDTTWADFLEDMVEIADWMNKNTRTWNDLTYGAKSHRDTLAYKIDKHSVNAAGTISADPIQSFYFANCGGVMEYIDTQVMLGKRYKYKLYAYDLVIGNQYKYEDAEVFPPAELQYPYPLGYLLGRTPLTHWAQSNSSSPNFNYRGVVEDPRSLPWATTWEVPPLPMQAVDPDAIGSAVLDPNSTAPEESPYLVITGLNMQEGVYAGHRRINVNPDFPLYVDITVGTGPTKKRYSRMINAAAISQTVRGDTAYVSMRRLAYQLERKINAAIKTWFDEEIPYPDFNSSTSARQFARYQSELRVRIAPEEMPDQDATTGTAKIFIAQVGSLIADGRQGATQLRVADRMPRGGNLYAYNLEGRPPPPEAIFNSPDLWIPPLAGQGFEGLDAGLTGFEDYFDLTYEDTGNWTGDTPPAVDVSIDFMTGKHGIEPVIPWDLTSEGTANVTVHNWKSPKIIEIPLGETNPIVVTDLPPQFPDVDIYPLKGSSKKIKILLNNNNCTTSYNPIIIEPEDQAIFDLVRDNQGRPAPVPLVFGSDDYKLTYQVYRTTIKPESYADFAGTLRATVPNTTPGAKHAAGASMIDRVVPNQTYYYCFRTIDKNGYLSVPTPILQVQMVDDNGRIYPIILPYEFSNADTRKTEISFRKYVEIDASLQEKALTTSDPEDTTGDGLSPYIAPTDVSIGTSAGTFASSTEFKVRIISKDTGRKLDLNLNFNVETIANPKIQGN